MAGEEHGFFSAYDEYSKTLRTWFVAYGVGVPVLFLSNEQLWPMLRNAGTVRLLATLFLAGVTAQVLLAVANKYAMWALYYGETRDDFQRRKRYRLADWFSEQFWVDFIVDVASLVMFGLGTYTAFRSVAV